MPILYEVLLIKTVEFVITPVEEFMENGVWAGFKDHTNSSVFTLVLALPFLPVKVIIVWPASTVIPVGCVKLSIVGAILINDTLGKIIVSVCPL